MAVMARILGIPARVAVGFLEPEQVGAGHVRVQLRTTCTPGPSCSSPARAGCGSSPPRRPGQRACPAYTDAGGAGRQPDRRPSATGAARQRRAQPRPTSAAAAGDAQEPAARPTSGRRVRLPVGRGAGRRARRWCVLGAWLLLAPRRCAGARREQRLAGGPEEAWAELRATAHRPRRAVAATAARRAQTRDGAGRATSAPASTRTPRAPAHGPDVAPDAVARSGPDRPRARAARATPATAAGRGRPPARRDRDLRRGAVRRRPARARRRADWWPRSVVAACPTAPPAGRRARRARDGTAASSTTSADLSLRGTVRSRPSRHLPALAGVADRGQFVGTSAAARRVPSPPHGRALTSAGSGCQATRCLASRERGPVGGGRCVRSRRSARGGGASAPPCAP